MYIETVPGKGYRFTAEVSPAPSAPYGFRPPGGLVAAARFGQLSRDGTTCRLNSRASSAAGRSSRSCNSCSRLPGWSRWLEPAVLEKPGWWYASPLHLLMTSRMARGWPIVAAQRAKSHRSNTCQYAGVRETPSIGSRRAD